jgi:S-adenosylmethionine uptake transporter
MRPYPTDHARPAVPFMVATGATMLFTTMDGVLKGIPHDLPILQVVAMRFLFGIPLVLLAIWHTQAGWPTLRSWRANGPRGVLNIASMALFYVALRRLPFAETLTLCYLAPLIVAVLAALLLRERLRFGVLAGVLLGLGGVGVITWNALGDGVSGDIVGILAAMGSAVSGAVNNVLLRSQAQKDSPTSIVLIQHIVPVLIALPVVLPGWQAPAPQLWFVFPLLAVLGVGGQFLMTWAFGRAPAGVLAVVDYLALPYAAVLGFVFFGEVPPPAVWVGATLIVAACVIVTRLRK